VKQNGEALVYEYMPSVICLSVTLIGTLVGSKTPCTNHLLKTSRDRRAGYKLKRLKHVGAYQSNCLPKVSY
jgi:hypothetical protein